MQHIFSRFSKITLVALSTLISVYTFASTDEGDIFFSKYFESKGNVKGVAIYNGSYDDISLENMRIVVFRNGNYATPTTIMRLDEAYWRNSETYQRLAPNKVLAGKHEVQFYNKADDATDNPIYDCLQGETDVTDWVYVDRLSNIGGAAAVVLERQINGVWTPIDIIGAIKTVDIEGVPTIVKDSDMFDAEGNPTDFKYLSCARKSQLGVRASCAENVPAGCEIPDWADGNGWFCTTQSGEVLGTNRCMLYRKEGIVNGRNAVEQNINKGNGFVTLATEWDGEHVPVTDPDQTATACTGFANLSNISKYVVKWYNGTEQIGVSTVLQNAENRTPIYSGEIPQHPTDPSYYNFVGWSETEGGSPVAISQISSNKSYYAVFESCSPYTLTLSTDGMTDGMVAASPVDCDNKVTINAYSGANYKFLYWSSDDMSLTDNQCVEKSLTLTLSQNTTITAHFAQAPSYDTLTYTYQDYPSPINGIDGTAVVVGARYGKYIKIPEVTVRGVGSKEDLGKRYTVVGIGYKAFGNSADPKKTVEEILVPSTLSNIHHTAFQDAPNLLRIKVDENNPTFKDVDGVLFNKAGNALLSYPGGRGDYVIPAEVNEIGKHAFTDCKKITQLAIPEGVTVLPDASVARCTRLTSLILPSTLERIEQCVFRGCTSLSSVDIPENVTLIGDSAFEGLRALTAIRIPDKVTEIGTSAFAKNTSMANVIIGKNVVMIKDSAFFAGGATRYEIKTPTPPRLDSDVRYRTFGTGTATAPTPTDPKSTLIVPCESKDLYKRDAKWEPELENIEDGIVNHLYISYDESKFSGKVRIDFFEPLDCSAEKVWTGSAVADDDRVQFTGWSGDLTGNLTDNPEETGEVEFRDIEDDIFLFANFGNQYEVKYIYDADGDGVEDIIDGGYVLEGSALPSGPDLGIPCYDVEWAYKVCESIAPTGGCDNLTTYEGQTMPSETLYMVPTLTPKTPSLSVYYNDTKVGEEMVACGTALSAVLASYLPASMTDLYKYDAYIQFDFSESSWETSDGSAIDSEMPADDYSVYLRSTTERSYPVTFQIEEEGVMYAAVKTVKYGESFSSVAADASELISPAGSPYSLPECRTLEWRYGDYANISDVVEFIRSKNDDDRSKQNEVNTLMISSLSYTTIAGNYEEASYNVYYVVRYPEEVNGEREQIVASTLILHGEEINVETPDAPDVPNGQCWSFDGWDETIFAQFNSVMPCYDVYVYGQFSVQKHSIVFKNEDGSVLDDSQTDIEYGTSLSYLPSVEPTMLLGHQFAGWDLPATMPCEDLELTPMFREVGTVAVSFQVVTLDENGNITTSEAYGQSLQFTTGSTLAAATVSGYALPNADGSDVCHDYSQWKISSPVAAGLVNYSEQVLNNDLVLYSVQTDVKYDVYYSDVEGATLNLPEEQRTVAYSCDEPIEFRTVYVSARCYDFNDKWEYKEQSDNADVWQEWTDDMVMPSKNIIIRPVLEIVKYAISFTIDDQSNARQSIRVECDQEIPELYDLGEDYTDWMMEDGSNVPTQMPNRDIAFYAKSIHTLTYSVQIVKQVNGQTQVVDNLEADQLTQTEQLFGSDIDFPDNLDAFNLAEDLCYDWNSVSQWVAQDGNQYSTVPSTPSTLNFVKTLTLNTYNVEFAAADGLTYNQTTQTIDCGGQIDLPSVSISDDCFENPNAQQDDWSWVYVRKSESLVGEIDWNRANSLTATWPSGVGEDIIARPVAQRKTYAVIFDVDGSEYSRENVTCGDEVNLFNLKPDESVLENRLTDQCLTYADQPWYYNHAEVTASTVVTISSDIHVEISSAIKNVRLTFMVGTGDNGDWEEDTDLSQDVPCGTNVVEFVADKVTSRTPADCRQFPANQVWTWGNGNPIPDTETIGVNGYVVYLASQIAESKITYLVGNEEYAVRTGQCGDPLPTDVDDPVAPAGQHFVEWIGLPEQTMPAGEITVVAQFVDNETRPITFNFVDSRTGEPYKQPVVERYRIGEDVVLIDVDQTTDCDSYSRWLTDAEDPTSVISRLVMSELPEEGVQLYSVRTRAEFSVEFDDDVEGLQQLSFTEHETYNCGDQIEYPTVTTDNCHSFAGNWEYKFANSSTWQTGMPTIVQSDYDGMTIRPLLTEKDGGTVTYYVDGVQSGNIDQFACGEEVEIRDLPQTPSCKQYTTTSWVLADGNTLASNYTIESEEEIALYLVSEDIVFTVRFEVDGVDIEDQEITCGETVEKPEQTDYLNDCQSFDWNGFDFSQSITADMTSDGVLTIYGSVVTNQYALTIQVGDIDDPSLAPQTYRDLFPCGESFASLLSGFEINGYGMNIVYSVPSVSDNIMPNEDLVVTINYLSPIVDEYTRCANEDPYCWNGLYYRDAGVYPYVDLDGRLHILNLTVNDVLTTSLRSTACGSFVWDGEEIVNTTDQPILRTLTHTFTAQTTGCDSVVTYQVTINPILTADTMVTFCGEQYVWHGKTYVRGEQYEEDYYKTILTSELYGCDSIVTLNLVFNDIRPQRDTTIVSCTVDAYDPQTNSMIKVFYYTQRDGEQIEIRREDPDAVSEEQWFTVYEPAEDEFTCDTRVLVHIILTTDGFNYRAVTNYTLPADEQPIGTLKTWQVPSCGNNNVWIVEAQETNPNYHFTQWDDSTTTNPRVLSLFSDTIIVANFVEAKPVSQLHTITFGTTNSLLGNVEAWIELQAVPFEDRYTFDRWEAFDAEIGTWYSVSNQPTETLDLDRNWNIMAYFTDNYQPYNPSDPSLDNPTRGTVIVPRPNADLFIPTTGIRPNLSDLGIEEIVDGVDETPIENSIFVDGQAITVVGHEGTNMQIYSVVGQLLYDGRIASQTTVVNVPAHNVYLVKIGTQIAKVIVK